MISLITVNWNAYDFLRVLIESIQRFTHVPYDLVIVDNSDRIETIEAPHLHQFITGENIGHGAGLNLGILKAADFSNPYTMFLDCDTHFLKHHWEDEFLKCGCDVIAAKGVPQKPIRPACLFMPSELAKRYDWRATDGYKGHRVTPEGTDVAIAAYHQMLKDGVSFQFLNSFPNRYGTCNGEEYGIDEPFCYHHWSGSWLEQRQVDFPTVNLLEDKKKLFSQIPWRCL